LLLWIALVAVAVVAPPTRPDLWEWIGRVMAGDWSGENPWLLAHFNLMGIWPVLFGVLLAPQWRDRPLPSWPFVVASMMTGAFSLLLFFVFRSGPPERVLRPSWTRWLTLAMGVMAAGLVGWGLLAGDVTDWLAQWRSEGLVFIMAADFVVLAIAFVLEARAQGLRWPLALFPVVGSAASLWPSEANES
jgi:hypothetical protein